MNRWVPDADPHQARRIGKTLEELSELANVLARISIQGLDSIDPASGKTNRRRMLEETADVLAQLDCNVRAFDLDRDEMWDRQERKTAQMAEWESHFEPGGDAAATGGRA
jgi:NTP pyrophosphatase (non-canonical NTP hydrolase)